jgi:DNA-binding GntR family transcriptional regulator
MLPLERRLTINEQVYLQIKAMIARRELPPGTPLVLRPLAGKLGVSKMPVIEAIRRLEKDGLVSVLPKWGATVKRWSREEILEACCIRRGLEAEAARFFVLRASAEEKKKLTELGDRFDAFAATDPVKCEEADMDFHLHIVRCTRFPRLYELIENSKIETATFYGLRVAMAQKSVVDTEANYRKSIGCHQPVIEALLRNDPEAAAQAISQHINSILIPIMKLEDGAEDPISRASGE